MIERNPIASDIRTMKDYLLSAFRRGDWHAVSDAANDIRVLEERLSRQRRPRRSRGDRP